MTKNETVTQFSLDDVGHFLAKFTEHSDHIYWISSADFKKIQYIGVRARNRQNFRLFIEQ